MEERNSLLAEANATSNQSYWMRDEIVPATASYSGFIRGNINLEHSFEIKSNAAPNITRLLRIDFWNKYDIQQFSIFHFNPLRDELTHKGQVLTNDKDEYHDFQRWIYVNPPAGKYLIQTFGGNYKYGVILLKSDLRLTDAVKCKVNNATQVTLSLPDKYDDIPKALSYRVDNRPTWLTTYSKYPHRKFKLEVEPESIYEVKMKLFIKGVFETEYSPPMVITEHQKWAETVVPDYQLLDLKLFFYFKMKAWPHRVEINLLLKLPDEEDWRKVSQEICKSTPGYVQFDLNNIFSERLAKDNMAIEWRLHFKDPQIDDREVWGLVQKFELKKRNNTYGIFNNMKHLTATDSPFTLFLASDGRFVLKRGVKKVYVRNGLGGDFIIENTSNNKGNIRLLPKYGISFDTSQIEQSTSNSRIFLPEILLIIFEYAIREYQYAPHILRQFKNISVVCKHWFNTATKKFLPQLFEGEFSFVDPAYSHAVKFPKCHTTFKFLSGTAVQSFKLKDL